MEQRKIPIRQLITKLLTTLYKKLMQNYLKMKYNYKQKQDIKMYSLDIS